MQQYSGRCSGAVDAKGDAEQTRQDIAECHRMAVEVPAARGCCEKVGRRQDHSGRRRGRQVWRRKTSREVEDASGGGRHIRRQKTCQKAEDTLEGRRRIGSRSRVQDGKVWDKGFPLTLSLRTSLIQCFDADSSTLKADDAAMGKIEVDPLSQRRAS